MATPQELANGASCFSCQIPTGQQLPVLISLLAEQAGVPTDAQTLMNNARCLDCIPAGVQRQVMIYLLGQLAGQTDPQTIMNNARCFSCVPNGMEGPVMIYLLDQSLNP